MAVRTGKSLTGVLLALGVVWMLTGVRAVADDSLKKGAWALQFEVNGDFDLGAFQGNTISFKKHTGDGTAYRVGFDIGLTDKTANGDDHDVDEYTSGAYRRTKLSALHTELDRQSFSLTVQRISYPSRERRVKFFYGFGPALSYSHKSDNRNTAATTVTVTDGDPPDTTDVYHSNQDITSSTKGWSAGVRGIFGVEWFASPSISLLAEYSSSVVYGWSRSESGSVTSTVETDVTARKSGVSDSDGIEWGAGAVKFGLSAYF